MKLLLWDSFHTHTHKQALWKKHNKSYLHDRIRENWTEFMKRIIHFTFSSTLDFSIRLANGINITKTSLGPNWRSFKLRLNKLFSLSISIRFFFFEMCWIRKEFSLKVCGCCNFRRKFNCSLVIPVVAGNGVSPVYVCVYFMVLIKLFFYYIQLTQNNIHFDVITCDQSSRCWSGTRLNQKLCDFLLAFYGLSLDFNVVLWLNSSVFKMDILCRCLAIMGFIFA